MALRIDRSRRRPGPSLVTGFVAVAIAGIAMLGLALSQGWISLNPFAGRDIDRSSPVLLERIRDLSEHRGASADLSVTVDLERDVGLLPQFIAGERTQYAAVGSVDATVDLGDIGPEDVTEREDGTIVITLPEARLDDVDLASESHVMNRDRGVLDRIGGVFVDSPTSERELQAVATRRLQRAAVETDVRERAERNTARTIEDLAAALGVDDVEVRFSGTDDRRPF